MGMVKWISSIATIAVLSVAGGQAGAATFTDAELAARAVTFNAPGAANYNAKLKGNLIRNVSRKSDVVGTMGRHIGKSLWVADLKFNPKKDIANPAGYLIKNHNIGDLIKDLRRWKR